MEKLIALRGKLDAIKAMGTNAKKVALAELDAFEQSMVSLMLNPFIRFGVKKYSVAEPALENKISDEDAIDILNSLASRKLTGNSAIKSSTPRFRCSRFSWRRRTKKKATSTRSRKTRKPSSR